MSSGMSSLYSLMSMLVRASEISNEIKLRDLFDFAPTMLSPYSILDLAWQSHIFFQTRKHALFGLDIIPAQLRTHQSHLHHFVFAILVS